MRYIYHAVAFIVVAASARAETCNIPTKDEVAAQTAKCLVSVDSKVILDERCKFGVSPDGRLTVLDGGKFYVEVTVTLDRRGAPTVQTAKWNRGSGRSDQLISLGTVTGFNRSGAYCFRNPRVEICASDYLTCKCGPNQYYGCQADE